MTISKKWDVKKNIIEEVYNRLYKCYGPQGWWPLLDVEGRNPTKTGSIKGYHPGNYSYPINKDQQFEIAIGAILTQNTAWPNVEKALINLKSQCGITDKTILKIEIEELKVLINPAGFFNQKSQYIKNYAHFFSALNERIPSRKELLSIKGIGEESADSILLYSFNVPTFIIDAYTRRIFTYLGIVKEADKYVDIKKVFEKSLPSDIVMYQEYHALIVEHAKRYYSKKPFGYNDSLLNDLIVSRK